MHVFMFIVLFAWNWKRYGITFSLNDVPVFGLSSQVKFKEKTNKIKYVLVYFIIFRV